MKTPVRDSPHKTGSEMKNDPVQTTQSKANAEIAGKSPRSCQRMPYSSPKVSLIEPKSFV